MHPPAQRQVQGLAIQTCDRLLELAILGAEKSALLNILLGILIPLFTLRSSFPSTPASIARLLTLHPFPPAPGGSHRTHAGVAPGKSQTRTLLVIQEVSNALNCFQITQTKFHVGNIRRSPRDPKRLLAGSKNGREKHSRTPNNEPNAVSHANSNLESPNARTRR